jgi:hypothetical protein
VLLYVTDSNKPGDSEWRGNSQGGESAANMNHPASGFPVLIRAARGTWWEGCSN